MEKRSQDVAAGETTGGMENRKSGEGKGEKKGQVLN
jgi:hypothetical protein